jgi:hypothetical protein
MSRVGPSGVLGKSRASPEQVWVGLVQVQSGLGMVPTRSQAGPG